MGNPADADPVLIDTTLVRHFLKRGFQARLEEYFGARVVRVLAVEEELQTHAEGSVPLRELLKTWPSTEVAELPPELQQLADDMVENYRNEGEHKDINRGEIETYFWARQLQKDGHDPLVISDDQLAKKLCRAQQIACIDTPTLLLLMVCQDFLSREQGGLIWRECFTNQARWKDYDTRLHAECGK